MYKLVGEKEGAFHIQHSDGSNFRVAKSGLSKATMDKIGALPKLKVKNYAFGTSDVGAGEEEETTAEQEAEPTTSAEAEQAASGQAPESGATVLSNTPPAPAAQIGQPSSQVAPQATTGDVGATLPVAGQPTSSFQPRSPMAVMGEEIAGTKKLGQIEAGGKAMQSGQIANYLKAQDSPAMNATKVGLLERQQAGQMEEINELKKQVVDYKIDPNRIWHNKGTGGRIAAAIGVMLGGLGGSLTGSGRNMALEVLNHAIDRDIDAQKAELGKKESLLSRNMQIYHNTGQAIAATKLQGLSILNAQMQMQALKSGSAAVMQNYNNAALGIEQQASQLQFKMAGSQVENHLLGGATGEAGLVAGSPEDMLMMRTHPDYTKQRVQVGSMVYKARDPKAAEELSHMQALYDPIKKDIELLKSLAPGAVLDPAQTDQATAALNRIAMAVNEFNGYKRFTDMDAEAIKHMFNDPSSIRSLLTGHGATADTMRSMYNKLESAKQYGLIGYKPVQSGLRMK